MTLPTPTCDQEGCLGHLGKFQSCRDEAIWERSLEFPDAETGSSEFEGHYALVLYAEPDTVTLPGGPRVTVPPGVYIVHSTDSGAVWVLTYETEAGAREFLAQQEAAYAEWEDA